MQTNSRLVEHGLRIEVCAEGLWFITYDLPVSLIGLGTPKD
jgi:hypothetical protein